MQHQHSHGDISDEIAAIRLLEIVLFSMNISQCVTLPLKEVHARNNSSKLAQSFVL